jgi:hypothetical protein
VATSSVLASLSALAVLAGDPPVELGAVRWQVDHDQAFAQARRSGQPVALFFQEVPG